jgi:hypothetical protein
MEGAGETEAQINLEEVGSAHGLTWFAVSVIDDVFIT